MYILEMLDKDNESEISHIDGPDKAIPIDRHLLTKAAFDYQDINKRSKAIGYNSENFPSKQAQKGDPSAYEYMIEEDDLSYRSSLHSAFME
jgi:hypothetical protein